MRHSIIKVGNYLLVVSDELLEIGDWCYGLDINGDYVNTVHEAGSHDLHCKHPKIIAHLPLNNSPILEGVDLLPPLEDDVEKLAEIYTTNETDSTLKLISKYSFRDGYNKAKETYKYTEEDLKNAFNEGYSIRDSYGDNSNNMTADEYIQSLQQPKLPIAFECKMNITHCDRCPDGFERWSKTITNSQGRTEWVGKYIY